MTKLSDFAPPNPWQATRATLPKAMTEAQKIDVALLTAVEGLGPLKTPFSVFPCTD